MRFSVTSAVLGTALFLTPVAAGYAPVFSQDFSITNPDQPENGSRRDVMRQLQAWWDVHAYYPKHASNNDEGGTVKVHLEILPDGRIWTVREVQSSGSQSLDSAAAVAFRAGFVRPFPEGAPGMGIDLSLHYVLAHRHDEPVAAAYKPASSNGPFTIANDPVKSPIFEKILQKTCTGTIVLNGVRNHPEYGTRYYGSKLVFFRKPDGTPWIEFHEGSRMVISPVVEVGRLVSWSGPTSYTNRAYVVNHYTAWLDANNKLNGGLSTVAEVGGGAWNYSTGVENTNGTLDFSCAEDVVPQIEWKTLYATLPSPSWDPP